MIFFKKKLKINPNGTIPGFLDGDDFSINESRPAATYLAEYYDRVGNLYPKYSSKKKIPDYFWKLISLV